MEIAIQISLEQAVSLMLNAEPASALTDYGFGIRVFQLCRAGTIQGQRLALRTRLPERRHYLQALRFATSYGLLRPASGPSADRVYLVGGRQPDSPASLYCAIDPFGYVAYLSAMALHGLTDRIPQTLMVATPAPKDWQAHARARMQRDLGEDLDPYEAAGFPRLQTVKFERLMGMPVQITTSLHLGAFRLLEGAGIRVSTIGRTFLDMLRYPEFCGGIHHVLDVFSREVAAHLVNFVDEVDRHGEPIDKVRAGYVIDEICGLDHPSLAAWATHAQRGGSRRLVAKLPYSPKYSARWCLSLNSDET